MVPQREIPYIFCEEEKLFKTAYLSSGSVSRGINEFNFVNAMKTETVYNAMKP